MKRKIGLALSFWLMIILVTGIAVHADNFPVTITDDLDSEVNLEEEPQKIVSLAPSNTEMLFTLGLGEKVVGVTQSANYPQSAREVEKIGTITEPNIEKIVSLEPDLVLGASINKMQSINKLKELGLTVAGFSPSNVHDTIVTLKKIGTLTGTSSRAQEIVTGMQVQLVEIKNMVDEYLKNHNRKKVFYEIWSDPLTTAGKNTFVNDLIELAGGTNIGAQAPGSWPQYSLEKLIMEDPEVFISTPHSAPEKVTPESIKNRKEFESIQAVENGNIHIVNQDIVNRPSPRIIKGLKIFVKAIHPQLTDKIEELD